MIMEKLIEQELEAKIEITSQDIVAFYQKHGAQNLNAADKEGNSITNFQDEKLLVSRLRMQKTQDSYEEWVKTLWEEYPVEIDKEKLKTFLIDIDTSKGS